MLNLLREQLESVCRHSPTLMTSSYITSSVVDSPFIICHVRREEKLTVRVKKTNKYQCIQFKYQWPRTRQRTDKSE